VLVVQGDPFNRSRIAPVVCVALTTNLRLTKAPGNVRLSSRSTGLPRDSVVNASQIVTLDRAVLSEAVGKLSARQLQLVLAGTDVVLGR
jgi:mRNA interferase MazF